MDAAHKIDSTHFGPGRPAEKTQGKADTLLEELIFACEHGPEDFRGGGSQNAAGLKLQRQSKKSQGLSYKARDLRSLTCASMDACGNTCAAAMSARHAAAMR
jgi:hypothetical protein